MVKREYQIIQIDTELETMRLIDLETGQMFHYRPPVKGVIKHFSKGSVITLDQQLRELNAAREASQDHIRELAAKSIRDRREGFARARQNIEEYREERKKHRALVEAIKLNLKKTIG